MRNRVLKRALALGLDPRLTQRLLAKRSGANGSANVGSYTPIKVDYAAQLAAVQASRVGTNNGQVIDAISISPPKESNGEWRFIKPRIENGIVFADIEQDISASMWGEENASVRINRTLMSVDKTWFTPDFTSPMKYRKNEVSSIINSEIIKLKDYSLKIVFNMKSVYPELMRNFLNRSLLTLKENHKVKN